MIVNQFRFLVLAIKRYTRFPIPHRLAEWASPPGLDTRRVLRFMPLAGLLIGLYNALTYLLLAQILPHSVATLLAVTVGVLLTAGRNEQAMTRFFDGVRRGLVSNRPAGARVRRDEQSQRGYARVALSAAGGLMLLFVVVLRIESLASLDPSWISIAMITGQPFSAGVAAVLMMGLAYRDSGHSWFTGLMDRLLAVSIALLPMALAWWWFNQPAAFTMAAVPALLFGWYMRRWVSRRLRAIGSSPLRRGSATATVQNGIGATQQIVEIAYYLGLLVWWSLSSSESSSDSANDGGATDDDEDQAPQ